MSLRSIVLVGMSLCAICCVSDYDGPTSAVRSAGLPDLTIRDVTYVYDYRAPGLISMIFTLRIQNIGRASFDSLLYVSWTGSKYALRAGYYSQTMLIYNDWSDQGVKPRPIVADEVIEGKAYSLAILDTNVVRFRIMTVSLFKIPSDAKRQSPFLLSETHKHREWNSKGVS